MTLQMRIIDQRDRRARNAELDRRQHGEWHRITDDGRLVGRRCERPDLHAPAWQMNLRARDETGRNR